MDRARRDFQAVAEVNPNDDLAMLVPAALTIQEILAAPLMCDCLRAASWRAVDAMEQLREMHSLPPRSQTH